MAQFQRDACEKSIFEIYDEYKNGAPIKSLCAKYKLDLNKEFKLNGLKIRTKEEINELKTKTINETFERRFRVKFKRLFDNIDVIKEMYFNGCSLREISDMFTCSKGHIKKILIMHNVTLRTKEEVNKLIGSKTSATRLEKFANGDYESSYGHNLDEYEMEKFIDYYNTHTGKDAIKYMGYDCRQFVEYRKNNPHHELTQQIRLEKQNNSMRLNNTHRMSKAESSFFETLKNEYPDVIRQYKDSRYGNYICDFYVPSEDLFIECHFHWSHGGHAFDRTNIRDLIKLGRWKQKAKTSKFYQNAINVWTERDVDKMKLVKDNNLNYIALYKVEDWIGGASNGSI